MTTTYRVRDKAGALLGIYPKTELLAIRELVQANPGAEVETVVTIDNPCATHPAYEADYCPACGTARSL